MSDYHTFTVSRTTEPDRASLVTALRNIDPTIGVQHNTGTNVYKLKTSGTWTLGNITFAQAALEAAPVASARLTAQAVVDSWPIEFKALVLALIDQLNVIRAALPTPLAPITPAQALQAIRNKAATL